MSEPSFVSCRCVIVVYRSALSPSKKQKTRKHRSGTEHAAASSKVPKSSRPAPSSTKYSRSRHDSASPSVQLASDFASSDDTPSCVV